MADLSEGGTASGECTQEGEAMSENWGDNDEIDTENEIEADEENEEGESSEESSEPEGGYVMVKCLVQVGEQEPRLLFLTGFACEEVQSLERGLLPRLRRAMRRPLLKMGLGSPAALSFPWPSQADWERDLASDSSFVRCLVRHPADPNPYSLQLQHAHQLLAKLALPPLGSRHSSSSSSSSPSSPSSNYEQLMKWLDSFQVDADAIAEGAETSLLTAAANGSAEGVVERLLEAGGDPLLCDRQGWAALHVAAKAGRTGALRALLSSPLCHDPDAPVAAGVYRGWTALLLAVSSAHEDAVRLLLSCPSVVACPPLPKHNRTVFHLVALYATPSILSLLLDRDPAAASLLGRPDSLGTTPLSLAALQCKPDLVRLLLEKDP